MEHEDTVSDAGYYKVALRLRAGGRLLHSNNERAFVMSQLQDALRRHTTLEDPMVRYRLAAHIDLLAFSILGEGVTLILFALHRPAVRALLDFMTSRLEEYQAEWPQRHSIRTSPVPEFSMVIRRLTGPHAALQQSVALHLRHTDWEYDRYSSIGFYLHDRRGDWMHLWRLSQLYENDSTHYQILLADGLTKKTLLYSDATGKPFVPLSHVS